MTTTTPRYAKLISMACLLMGLATSGWANQAPDELISQLTADLYELIDTNRERYEQDPGLLRKTVDQRMRQHVDVLYAGRLVLGRHGRGLEAFQIEAFANALANLLMNEYADRLLDFDSENQVEVQPLAPDQDPRRTRVRTRLRLDNGSVMPMDYVLREQNGRWLVFDVIAEGMSYVATFRTQIGEQITQQGFDATLEGLEKGAIQLEAEPQ